MFEKYNIELIILVIFLISINDIMAYAVGKKIGKTKVFPKISPNKSLEGTLTGIFFTICVSLTYAIYFKLDLMYFSFFGLFIGIFGLFGDLYISSFKRKLNIKDISNFIPGHGGLLDRLDSYLFCMPLSIIFFEYINIS